MVDQYVDTESTGCLAQIKEAIVGVLVAPLLALVAIGVLFWNEGRAVKRARDLEAGQKAVVSLESNEPDSEHDGDLVHVTGDLEVGEAVTDEEFGVTTKAVELHRTVEMYQWEEEEERRERSGDRPDKVTYTYRRVWSPTEIDSSGFKHESGHRNPPKEIPFDSKRFVPDEITLGGYTVESELTNKLDADGSVEIPESVVEKIPPEYRSSAAVDRSTIFLHGRPASPKVGDVRVRYRRLEPQTVSIAAGQDGEYLRPYTSEKLYDEIALIQTGRHSADQLFATAKERNTMITWLLRGGGWIALMIAIGLFFQPLEMMAGSMPLIGWLAEDLVEVGTSAVSFLGGTAIAAVVIAIGWVFYRPLIGLALLLVAGVLIGGIVYLIRAARAERETA